ncbi:MAG TPA: quinolinate synthase NadA [Candidatus Dormibacteraeota bacterium]
MAVATQGLLTEEIAQLRRDRHALILAHNYQRDEVQDVADFVGDSLGLSRRAAETDAEVIVFCGVHFMAETAAVLAPDRTVLLPDLEAGCSLAASISADELRAWKRQHPGAVVVSYVNTSAAVKAESDYCCTSSNAVEIVERIPADREILFCPDLFLGSHVERVTGRKMHVWLGECHVHAGIQGAQLSAQRAAHPGAEVLVHPECGCTTSALYEAGRGELKGATVVASTEGMVRHAQESEADSFIVATEIGVMHRMRQLAPEKNFLAANPDAVCPYMKMITLEKVRDSLRDLKHQVTVPAEIADRARLAIDRMVEVRV